MTAQQSNVKNGSIAAAMLAAGIGCFFLGLTTDLSESIKAVENLFTFSKPVGALSGKTIIAYVIWFVSWGILAAKWREQTVNFGKIFKVTIVLVVLGLIMTFPEFFDLL